MIHSNGIQPGVHDVDPAVFGGEDEEGHESLPEVVKVVGPIDPDVPGIRIEAISPIPNVPDVGALAVIEAPLEQLEGREE